MKRLLINICLTFALFGLLQASGPDDNSDGGPYHPFANLSYKDKMVYFRTNTYYEVYSINGKLLKSGYGNSINLKTLSASPYIIKIDGYAKKVIIR